jgi:hypothetical protein
VPAAAVIPAPLAYIKVVAVKKLVVEPLAAHGLGSDSGPVRLQPFVCELLRPSLACFREQTLYFEKIRVFKAGSAPEYISME